MYIAALFRIAKVEPTQMLINRWRNKESVFHIHNRTLFHHCKKMMQLQVIIFKWNKPVSERQTLNVFSCMSIRDLSFYMYVYVGDRSWNWKENLEGEKVLRKGQGGEKEMNRMHIYDVTENGSGEEERGPGWKEQGIGGAKEGNGQQWSMRWNTSF